MTAKKDERPLDGETARKPANVVLYEMPENLDQMSAEEIEELARRIYEAFRAAARPED